MRRPRVKVGRKFGTAILSAVGSLILALTLLLHRVGPAVDYQFLAGRSPLESTVSGSESARGTLYSEFRVFGWQEPYARAVPVIEAELFKKGFRRIDQGENHQTWHRDDLDISVYAERVDGRPVLEKSRKDDAHVLVIVSREIEDDPIFHLRLMFSPYGIRQLM